MHEDFYETNKALSEYLLFHYGEPNEVLPWDFGPANALNYPIRCITECINTKNKSSNDRHPKNHNNKYFKTEFHF